MYNYRPTSNRQPSPSTITPSEVQHLFDRMMSTPEQGERGRVETTGSAQFKVYVLANQPSSPDIDVLVSLRHRPSEHEVWQSLRALAERLCVEHPSISIDEEILGGSPHIKGTRLSVKTILGKLYLYESVQAVVDIYEPHLTAEQVKEAIAYAQDFLEMSRVTSEPQGHGG